MLDARLVNIFLLYVAHTCKNMEEKDNFQNQFHSLHSSAYTVVRALQQACKKW